MNATTEKDQQIKDFAIRPLVSSGDFGVNGAGTGSKIDTPLTHAGSLDVLAGHLYRHRPRLPPIKQRLVSNLIEQIGNYENNPDRK